MLIHMNSSLLVGNHSSCFAQGKLPWKRAPVSKELASTSNMSFCSCLPSIQVFANRSIMRRVSKHCLRQGLSRLALLGPSEGSVSNGYASLAARQPSEPQLPPCDYQPRPYNGPSKPEVLAMRKKYLSPG